MGAAHSSGRSLKYLEVDAQQPVGQTIAFRGLSVFKRRLSDRRQKAIICPTSDLMSNFQWQAISLRHTPALGKATLQQCFPA